MAALKALPTDDEIEEARNADPSVTDAASYFEYIQARLPTAPKLYRRKPLAR